MKTRIDVALVKSGLCDSREKAQRAIMAGLVEVGGRIIDKPGTTVSADAPIKLKQTDRYVGRGALKLEEALRAFRVDPSGRVALDIGASTGGFTDCLLQHGARRVHALDVGRGQLHWKLRQDDRVVVREEFNARYLTPSDIDGRIDLVVADVSFISLELILGPAFALLSPGADMIVLIKPQFELSPDRIGKGGIVRDPADREVAITKIRSAVHALGHEWLGLIESPIRGRDGNIEFLAHLLA